MNEINHVVSCDSVGCFGHLETFRLLFEQRCYQFELLDQFLSHVELIS